MKSVSRLRAARTAVHEHWPLTGNSSYTKVIICRVTKIPITRM